MQSCCMHCTTVDSWQWFHHRSATAGKRYPGPGQPRDWPHGPRRERIVTDSGTPEGPSSAPQGAPSFVSHALPPGAAPGDQQHSIYATPPFRSASPAPLLSLPIPSEGGEAGAGPAPTPETGEAVIALKNKPCAHCRAARGGSTRAGV